MLSWTISTIFISCALAHVIACAHATSMKEVFQLIHRQQMMHSQEAHAGERRHQDKLPTQPIHRTILSNKKRTILRENHASGGSIGGVDSSLRSAKVRRVEDDSSKNEDVEERSQSYDEESSPSEPTPPLLTSPIWVKIHEEFGQNSFNYVPGSRRAASSAMFTYNYSNDRLLQEQKGGIQGAGNHTNSTTEALEQRSDGDSNNSTSNNATESTTEEAEEADVEDENNKSNSTAEALEQGIKNDTSANSTVLDNTTEGTAEGADDNKPASGNAHEHTSESPTQQAQGPTTNENTEEYIIISGGYTDRDWKTFPVYAFSLTSSIRTLSGQWIDLSPSELDVNAESLCNEEDGTAAREKLYQEAKFLDANDNNSTEDPWEHAEPCAPSGRMGHQSVIHDDKLYVFGGLIYDEEQAPGGHKRKETFRLEDVPFVYRLDLNERFEARQAESKGGRSMQKVTGWQRIIPRVKPFSTPNGMSSTSAAEVLLSSVNRGEMQGGLWSSEDKFVMYGGLRIAKLDYEGHGHDSPSKFVKGGSAFGSSSQMESHKIVELPLGDVWAYDLVLDCWEKITNSYGKGVDVPTAKDGVDAEKSNDKHDEKTAKNKKDDDWLAELGADYSLYPRPRTAHAATVVGNQLIIHGGMGWDEHTNDWDGSTDWETLDDMWILDLNTREWKRRWLFPLLVRSYHSLVGWSVDESMMGWGKEFENYTSWQGPVVAAFGGYTTGVDVFSGEEVAYVFDDLLVSYPPPKSKYEDTPSPWLKATMSAIDAEMISNRYEHSAALSKEGILAVWGGSFQDTSDVKGLWMINIAGKDSTINLSMAESDSIYDDYERTITALHTIVIMLMFMSISLTLLLGLTQRYHELVQQANDESAVAAGMAFAAQDFGNDHSPVRRGNGLHPEIIDTIPMKIYSASDNDGAQDGEQECCPICLLEYSEGDELRVLPCNHFMHKSCLDAWLANNPSCPSCRYSLRDLVDDRPMMQLRTLRSRLSNTAALARFLGQDYEEGGIEMTDDFSDGSLPRGAVIDLRYVSSLALSEEDTVTDARGEDQQQGDVAQDPDAITHSAMDEIGSWRSRRRQLQRGSRRSSLASLRQNMSQIRRNRNQRGSRVPLADLDES